MTVTYVASRRKWRAMLTYEGTRTSLGMYETEEEANAAVLAELLRLSGDVPEETKGDQMGEIAIAEPVDDLGTHNGLPIMGHSIKITNTGDGLSKTMAVAPMRIEDGGDFIVSMRIKHTRTYYDNVFSKDDPDELIGYVEVTQFSAKGAVFDDRADASERVDEMEARIAARAAAEADAAETAKREAAGEFKLALVED